MSYARFSEGDIYLFYHMHGYYICMTCSLASKVRSIFTVGCDNAVFQCDPCKHCDGAGCEKCMVYGDTIMHSAKEAIDHVNLHIEKGHDVPLHTLPSLEDELKEEISLSQG